MNTKDSSATAVKKCPLMWRQWIHFWQCAGRNLLSARVQGFDGTVQCMADYRRTPARMLFADPFDLSDWRAAGERSCCRRRPPSNHSGVTLKDNLTISPLNLLRWNAGRVSGQIFLSAVQNQVSISMTAFADGDVIETSLSELGHYLILIGPMRELLQPTMTAAETIIQNQ